MVDANTKWLEVHVTSSSTSAATIDLMKNSFAALGLPEVIVSDNAATFTSDEFGEFLKRNGARHVRTPPYHPASNDLAERAVQTLKEGLKKLTNGSLNTRLARFLFKYRITPQSSTGVSPAELLYGRRLRSQLDLLHPDLGRRVRQEQDRQKQGHDVRSKSREFGVADKVYARNYGSGPLWLSGTVLELCGAVSYSVQLEDGRQVRRHIDQLRSRACNSCTRVQEDGQTPDERMSEYDVINSGNAFTETRAVDPDTSELSTFASETDSMWLPGTVLCPLQCLNP